MTKISIEDRTAVHEALAEFAKISAGLRMGKKNYDCTDSGIIYTYPFALPHMSNVFNHNIWVFHDVVSSSKRWHDQCKDIAYVLGPSKHAITLFGLAYALYEGWKEYFRIHGAIPVHRAHYFAALLASDNLEETIKQEF